MHVATVPCRVVPCACHGMPCRTMPMANLVSCRALSWHAVPCILCTMPYHAVQCHTYHIIIYHAPSCIVRCSICIVHHAVVPCNAGSVRSTKAPSGPLTVNLRCTFWCLRPLHHTAATCYLATLGHSVGLLSTTTTCHVRGMLCACVCVVYAPSRSAATQLSLHTHTHTHAHGGLGGGVTHGTRTHTQAGPHTRTHELIPCAC